MLQVAPPLILGGGALAFQRRLSRPRYDGRVALLKGAVDDGCWLCGKGDGERL